MCVSVFTCVHNNKGGCVCCPVSEAGAAVMLWLLSLQTDSPDIVAPSTHTPTRPKHILIQRSLQQMLMRIL